MADEKDAPVATEAEPMEAESTEAAPAAEEEKKPEEAKGEDEEDEDDDAPLNKPAPSKKKPSTPKAAKPATQGSRSSARERKTVERLQLPDARPTAEKVEIQEVSRPQTLHRHPSSSP